MQTPETTEQRKTKGIRAKTDWDTVGKKGQTAVSKGLSAAAMSKKYGMGGAYAPRLHNGSFKVPLGASERHIQGIAKEAVRKWVDALDQQGWDWKPDLGWRVDPGMYPARDLNFGNTPILDMREYVVQGYFCMRKPEPSTIEIPAQWLERHELKTSTPPVE